MNRRVYLCALFLVFLSLSLVAFKVVYGGQKVAEERGRRELWRVSIVMNIEGKGERAKVRLTLPQDNSRQTVYNEHFENDALVFYVRQRKLTGNRIGFWRSEILDGTKTLEYTFSAQMKSQAYTVPTGVKLAKDPAVYPDEIRHWLEPSAFIQNSSVDIRRQLQRVIRSEKRPDMIVRMVYDFVRGEVKYKSEKGSKDAREALTKLVADCGGQARLFAALTRAAGIPTRIVGGIILKGGVKSITHVWTECYVGNEWIPFDTVNHHYAYLPADYLELYRGDYYLIKHTGLNKFNYFFVIGPERIPPVDNPWSLYALPIHFQSMIRVILLIPVGALVVAFFRTVVGVPTFGTFSPILLALAFREVSPTVGLACLGAIIFVGWLVRSALDHFKILVIPRLSIIVTLVVLMVLFLMVAGYRFGQQKILYISLFPFIIMTWTIERFSVLEIEDGLRSAFKSLCGTLVVAAAAYLIMERHDLRTYLFAFPELLLIIIAALLVLGRYTGIRLSEIWRFREFNKAPK